MATGARRRDRLGAGLLKLVTAGCLTLLWPGPSTVAAAQRCEDVPGNLVPNCGFAKSLAGWRPQAVTTLAHDPRRGSPAAGALRMTNQPASEAGAATCVALPADGAKAAGVKAGGGTGAGRYELSGRLQRVDGPGECLAFLEEHTRPDCGGGAVAFHTLATEPLVAGAVKQVAGAAALRPGTVAVRAGFACYGEQDDDVQSVLLDDVVLRRAAQPASARAASPTSPGPR
jgi:hypothetical protein